MDDAQAIRKLGFHKWYERKLLVGHTHLVLLLASAVGLLGTVEVFSVRSSFMAQIWVLLCFAASAVIAWMSLQRYMGVLGYAEYVAQQATCPACKAYARWEVQGEPGDRAPQAVLRVRCRACTQCWDIHL